MAGRRCVDLFYRVNHFSIMPPFSPYSNVHFFPNLMGLLDRGHFCSQPTSGHLCAKPGYEMLFGRNLNYRVQCMSSNSGSGGRMSARLSQMHQMLEEAESRAAHANEPVPKVTLEHVTIGYARSGGPGGQNVNKVNTKVDMRFNVIAAGWLPLRVRERILQLEKNRINSDGELVISSTKTRSQKDNVDDALGKLQAIIDAAAYVPPAPTEEKIKKIKKLVEIGEQKRLQTKRVHSLKKAGRRNNRSWD